MAGLRHSVAARPLLLLLAALLLAACDVPRAEQGRQLGDEARDDAPPVAEVVDAAGRTHAVGAAPTRILSLVPSATLALLELGEGGRLVGRTEYDTASALAHLPSVGGGLEPNLEFVLSLRPDLVIRFAGPSDPLTPQQLDRLGIAHFAVRPDGIEDVRHIVGQLGTLTGAEARALSVVAALDSALDDVRARVAGRAPVRVVFLVNGTPPWAAGPGTFMDELVRLAGGVNVFSDLDALYAPVSPEELVARGADVILTLNAAGLDPRLVRGALVREVGDGVQVPGPGLAVSARAVARALHPAAFP